MGQNRFEFTRADRIRKAMMREVSDILLRQIQDPRLPHALVSVTDAHVSGDLQHSKVFVSIFGDADTKKLAMTALDDLTPRIRHEVGQRIRLRFTPTIKFILDDSLERGTRVTALLNQILSDTPLHEAVEPEPSLRSEEESSPEEPG